PPPTSLSPLSLHDALPIYATHRGDLHVLHDALDRGDDRGTLQGVGPATGDGSLFQHLGVGARQLLARGDDVLRTQLGQFVLKLRDRKSTRLNSSHVKISYA